jgi:two-component system sensor histidine kinase KdpD
MSEMPSSPDHFLDLIKKSKRGKFKVYIGMSAGVGKTFRMLQEAHTLLKNKINVQIGYIETHKREETHALVDGLPEIPRRSLFYKGKELDEMDVQAILNASPEVVLVDELAHTNIPGSKNEKRWQDVVEILDAGISVISAVNIQHIESLNKKVQEITKIEVSERVPDSVLKMADEVVNIDLTSDELIARLKQGKIYDKSKIETALTNFFLPAHLLQLRELALREVAHQVERKIESEVFNHEKFIPDKILACISTNDEGAKNIIRKTSRLAAFYGFKWCILYVQTPREDSDKISLASQRHLINNFKMATELGAEVIKKKGEDVAKIVTETAKEKECGLIIMGTPNFGLWNYLLGRNLMQKIVKHNPGMDIIIVA